MKTPYDLYLEQQQTEKEAFDVSALAHMVQPGIDLVQHAGHLLQHPAQLASAMMHGGIEAAGTAVGSHAAINAALRAKHKFLPQITRSGNRAGILHALQGRTIRPGAHEAASLMFGREAMVSDYDMAHNLTKKILEHPLVGGDKHKALGVMREGARNPIIQELGGKSHTIKDLQEAIKGLHPEQLSKKPGLLERMYTTDASKITEQGAAKSRRMVGVGGSLAAGTVGLATGNWALSHAPIVAAVNAARAHFGSSNAGKGWMAGELAKGFSGKKWTPMQHLGLTLAASPAAADLRGIGHAVGEVARSHAGEAKGIADAARSGADITDTMAGFLTERVGVNKNVARDLGELANNSVGAAREVPKLVNNLKPTISRPVVRRPATPGGAALALSGAGVGVGGAVAVDAMSDSNRRQRLGQAETRVAQFGEKVAATVFLGGTVSGKDGEWREEVKKDLRENGHKPIDPKKPADEWDPAKDIYKEIKQILGADKVVFFKGGYFTKKEKEVCEAAGKPYEVVRKPEEVVEKVAFNVTVPVDIVGSLKRTPSPFPEDSKGHALTLLRAARSGDLMGTSMARYLRSQSLVNAGPIELGVLASLSHTNNRRIMR